MAAPQSQQKQPKLDPPKMQDLVVQPDGCFNFPLFPEDQDMLPALPTPDVLKELEALNVQCPELAERARKRRTPGPRGSQLVGSGQAASAQAGCVPLLGVGAKQAIGAPLPAAGVQSSDASLLDAGTEQDSCTAPPGDD